MTTVACTQGEDVVTLTVPKAAYETGHERYTHPIVQYPSGWVGEHQADAGGNSYPGGQPTASSQDVSQPGSTNGKPKALTLATGLRDGSHPSYKTYQPAAPTSAAGSNDDHRQPGQGNPHLSVPADGSPESNSKTQMNPSQPSSPKSLTTETSPVPTPQLNTSAIPSQPSTLHQGQVPSESKEAPHATSMDVSEAHSYELSSWITMSAIVGVVLLL
ncbi:uncharacterized protein BKA55DRAFT_695271 [Fusarium redolens]|uniref:Uncharacterized protein n=1 Tax=Fusarium redolens TaxID=48865 RepID=A0A9P9G733_FUSRE|nr:uncharacterized protein BKA55DRAFT_695271 [Fusarium redolens]KAH7233761.1 hypothetical protein BKA55DRAFT_695271 [Fusarium redolens]